MSDARLHSLACERNRDPILAVLKTVLPSSGLVLEIASGTGMHAVYFAPRLTGLEWQPSDADDVSLASIEAWREAEPAPNLRAPVRLDVTAQPWPVERADAIFNANMIHISPFEACLGLLDGAARLLSPGGALALYGPFMVEGRYTAPSNEAFDASLRARDPRWGVRDLDVVTERARERGLEREQVVPMPANNLTVVFRRG
jgi:SAM-dependent methyltransferase